MRLIIMAWIWVTKHKAVAKHSENNNKYNKTKTLEIIFKSNATNIVFLLLYRVLID